jgi:YVTN family beta-propeller protein
MQESHPFTGSFAVFRFCRFASLLVFLFACFTTLATLSAAERQLLWQTNSYGDDVHVIDVATNKVVKKLTVGPQPHGIAAPDDAHVVFVAIEAFKKRLGELIWVDPRTYKIIHRMTIGPKPNQLACTPDGRWVYVPCADGHYWVIDARDRTVVTKIQTGGRPHNTQASRDGKRMYLSPMGSPKKVTIVDVAAGHKVIGHIPFGSATRPPALEANQKRFFQHVDGLVGFEVADIEARKVTHRVKHKIPDKYKGKGSRCHGLAIRPDQKEIWSCNVEHKTVHIHDITKPDCPEIAAVPMIGRVYWLTFSPDSKFAYLAVRSESKTCVVDTATKKIVAHVKVGNTPKRNLVITLRDEK